MFFVLGGFFAFIKWTTFPVLFILLSVFIFAAGDFKKLKSNILMTLPFAAIMLVLLACFPNEAFSFLLGLYQQETSGVPQGISLARVFPVAFVKLMPLLLILLGIFYFRRYQDTPVGILPFWGGTGILMLTYPTVAYEYSVCSLCFLIPFVIYWAEWAKDAGWSRAYLWKYGFFLFLLIASCSVFLSTATGNEYLIFGVYGVAAAGFFLAPVLLPRLSAINLPSKATS
jgi:hypothetical protein